MKKFIVPTRDRILKWKAYFSEGFQTEEHHRELMEELVRMSMYWTYDQEYGCTDLLEASMELADELEWRGLIYATDTSEVGMVGYEICIGLVNYLKSCDILGVAPTVISFEGFVNMNMVIKVLATGEPYVTEQEQRACLSG